MTASQFDPLFESMLKKPTIFLHGANSFDSCSVCDEPINEGNPGKRVESIKKGRKYIDHICNDCFNDPDYQYIMENEIIISITNFNN